MTEEKETRYPHKEAEEEIREYNDDLLSTKPVIQAESIHVEGDLIIGSKSGQADGVFTRLLSYVKKLAEKHLLLVASNIFWLMSSLT